MNIKEKEIKSKVKELFFEIETEKVQEKITINKECKISPKNIHKVKEENKSNIISIYESENNILYSTTMELPKIKRPQTDTINSQNKKIRNSVNVNSYKENRSKCIIFSDEEWNQMITNNSIKYINQEKLIFSLKLGINDNLRGKIWMLIYNTLKVAMNHNENLYYKLVNTEDASVEDIINKDIERTIVYSLDRETNKMKQIDISSKHTKLFNILKAYAILDAEVSYCQGTNYIVAVLLTTINSERASFWTFVQIMNEKKWRDIFKQNTPKLMRMLDILRDSIKEKIPDLFEYFQYINFIDCFPAVFTQYFVTLFSYNCPLEYAYRVFDLFWKYEEKIIFDCLIHILNLQKGNLMNMEMDVLFSYIRDKIVQESITTFGLEKALPFKSE